MPEAVKPFAECLGFVSIIGKNVEFLIADSRIPWKAVPEGYVTRVIPASTWAVFPCRGSWPNALLEVDAKIWNEWLPNNPSYRIVDSYYVEAYIQACADPEKNYGEIWVMVENS